MSQLETENIVASYGRNRILKGVSAKFGKGRFTALIGPNGCGKSTLLKAVMGFVPLDSGDIHLDGAPITKIKRRELAKKIAYLPQDSFCPDHLSLGELIELAGYARYSFFGGPSKKDREMFWQALDLVGLAGMVGKRVNSLSGGQKQRAFIAMVLAQDADVILLDEPVNHLDMKYQYTVLDIVRNFSAQQGKTVVAVLHDLNMTAAFADDVVMLRDGQVAAAGVMSETVTAETVHEVFDLPTQIFEREGRIVCLPQAPSVPKMEQAL